MTDGGDRSAAGGPVRHVPVLREEVMRALDLSGGLYLDATFGAGGYSRAILEAPGTRLLALDRDPAAIRDGAKLVENFGDRLTLREGRFAELDAIAREAGLGPFDGIALDIGVSSMQLDQAERGFSFRHDGPLDMRMGASGFSAADIVNHESAETIADILYHFGEERASRRIARAIVADRVAAPFLRTRQLAEMIARILPAKPTDIHPATRTFQALRIAVNDELGELLAGLAAAERLLKPGGRLAVVTFHSLEDRIVKLFFAARSGKGQSAGRRLPGEAAAVVPSFTCPKGQPIPPSAREIEANPRARSAKLRFAIRTDQPALAVAPALALLATLPSSTVRPGTAR